MNTGARTSLDKLEAQLRLLAAGHDGIDASQEEFDAFMIALQEAEHDDLSPQPPQAEPDEARGSTAELRALFACIVPSRVTELSSPRFVASVDELEAPTRAGYALHDKGGQVEAVPAFAHALAQVAVEGVSTETLAERFQDLSLIASDVWCSLLDGEPVRVVARKWLDSPGRRLVQDIGFLADDYEGSAPRDTEALMRAAGLYGMPVDAAAIEHRQLAEHSGSWRALHCSWPGGAIRLWEPADGAVTAALHILDQPSPASLRGAALTWLLQRAVHAPHYSIDGLRRDLREDLPVRLAAALQPSSFSRNSAELEVAMLQHAMLLSSRNAEERALPQTVQRAWGLSRWLHICFMRSPFYGGSYGADEERLAIRLRALLPKQPLQPHDVLDPVRFHSGYSIDSRGLDFHEVVVLGGILGHYAGAGPHLSPMPLPIVNWLRRVATRTLGSGEVQAEQDAAKILTASREHPGTSGNALGWEASHIAPPWVARRLLTEHRIGWLHDDAREADASEADASEAVALECLEQLQRQPQRFSWLCLAFFAEGRALSDMVATRLINCFRELVQRIDTEPNLIPLHELTALPVGVLARFSNTERAELLDLVVKVSPEWRPFLLDAYAEAAERGDASTPVLTETRQEVLRRLLDIVENRDCNQRERLQSAFLIVRRIGGSRVRRSEFDDTWLGRLPALMDEPPFREHQPLQREVRRLGLHALSSSA